MEIKGYRLGRKIAETELCSVHNAIDPATSKTVSVRIFSGRLVRHPGFCAGFGRFAESVQGERLGAMVGLRDYASAGDGCYAVTDYFPCLPLLQTQPQQLPVKAVLQGGIEIAATLDLLHARDLVHGALRPGNLFFNDRLKLILGLGINRPEGKGARPLPAGSVTAALYVPPDGGDGPGADWYALGVCLYQQLTGQAPFDEQDAQRQLKQKQAGIGLLPESAPQSLRPLLQGLLHPDPKQRIDSTEAFWKQADDGGFRLLRPGFAAEPTMEVPVAPVPAAQNTGVAPAHDRPQTDTPEGRKTGLLIAAGILVIATVAGFLLWPGGENRNTESPVAAAPEPEPAAAAAIEPTQTSTPTAAQDIPPLEELPQDEQHYLQARSLLAEGQPGKALMAINESLRINPDSADARKLRQSIQNELEIRSILQRAERQLQSGKLDAPPGDNALESYRSLARLLPKGDPRMQRGLSRIANRFVELSRKAVAQRRLAEARQLAESGARLFPSFAPLQVLREDIARQQEQLRIASQRQLQEQRKREQIRQIEQARQARRQQLAAQRQKLIDSFNQSLATEPPTMKALDKASVTLAELQKLDTPVKQLQLLRNRLIDARLTLSEQYLQAGRFDEANATLQQGLELGDESGRLQEQIRRLQQAIEERRQRQQAEDMLAEAQALVSDGNASLEDLKRAESLLDQAGSLVPREQRTDRINQQLLRVYDRQAAAALEAGRLDEAAAYIRQGLARAPGDAGLKTRNRELQQARKKEEQRRSVPVIGTF